MGLAESNGRLQAVCLVNWRSASALMVVEGLWEYLRLLVVVVVVVVLW